MAALMTLSMAATQDPAPDAGPDVDDPVYEVETLNEGYTGAPEGELFTPKSALGYFVDAARERRYAAAAHVLNMNGVPPHQQGRRGPELARKLAFVLDRNVEVNWNAIPDRPDAVYDLPIALGERAEDLPRGPRRTLLVGLVDGRYRDTEVRLERVQPPNEDPVWVISRSTVDQIDELYEQHGPGWLSRMTPEWMALASLNTSVRQALSLVLAVLFAAAVGTATRRLLRRAARGLDPSYLRLFIQRTARPLTILVSTFTLWLTVGSVLVLEGELNRATTTLLQIGLIVALSWFGVRAASFLAEDVGRDHVTRLAKLDEARARQRDTMISVARRTLVVIVVLVGAGIMLSQFSIFRTLGTSLLASAGLATIVLGIAAQSSLGNLMAGIQIALTRPLRIGDTIQFQDTWSYVEDITYTYVVIRSWDHRRFVVPNEHIISTPQENWDVTRSNLVIPIHLHVDYDTPVEVMRQKYMELVEASEEWDWSTVPELEVVDAHGDTLELRALCSAADAVHAWRLSVWLREQLTTFLREHQGGSYLPRRRLTIEIEDAGQRQPRRAHAAARG